MKVLTFTSLFPNRKKPDFGVFIKKRMSAYAQIGNCDLRVVAPVPYFPKMPYFKKYSHFAEIPVQEIIDGIPVYHPRYPLIPKISMPVHGELMYYGSKRVVEKVFNEFKFNIIDGHFIFPDCKAAVKLGRKFNVPVISSARGSDINEFISYSSIRPQIIDTLKKSTKVISVCQALKNMMVDHGIAESKISVIPNGIDQDLFFPIEKELAIQKLHINQRSKIILSVGSLIKRKSHDLTIKAVKTLLNKGYDIQLYIIGSGEEQNTLKKLICELKINDRVFLIGQVPNEDLNLWYNASDVFCLASAREGWANVLTESLACGTPVVATNVFGASEIVRDSSMGILVERSHDSIAAGLEKALSNEWGKMKISKLISERTWDAVAQEVDSVFREAMDIFF